MAAVHKLNGNGNGPSPKIAKLDKLEEPLVLKECIKSKLVNEGKTKMIWELDSPYPGICLIESKDIITAGDGAKRNDMEGKAVLSNQTNGAIMQILNNAGVPTAYRSKFSDKSFLATQCAMIPIEWVTRRVATGSFLRRNKGVTEGYKFSPPKLETFYKDDENHDPQWSREVLEEAKLVCGGITITPDYIDLMEGMTIAIFEILERAWKTKNVTLVDMKIEFGVDLLSKEIVLADVIDNDSWRIWPKGNKAEMKDKQVYRNLTEVTQEAMQNLKKNYKWVVDQVEEIQKSMSESDCRPGMVSVIMGSPSDRDHCNQIKEACEKYGAGCELHVSSAHKSTSDTLKLLAKIESAAIDEPAVVIAVAGRSNGLGPVLSGNTVLPVINCPPVTPQWASSDIWSSLRLPSGLGCSTVLSTEAAALQAAQILAQHDVVVWCMLRGRMLQNWMKLKKAAIQLL